MTKSIIKHKRQQFRLNFVINNIKQNETNKKQTKRIFFFLFLISCVELCKEFKLVKTKFKIIVRQISQKKNYWILHTGF